MSTATRLNLMLLASGFSLGVLGDALLHVIPWGVNAGLWTMAIAVLMVSVVRDHSGAFSGSYVLLVVATLFAGGLAWRDSLVLAAMNVLVALTALALAPLRTPAGKLRLASLTDYLLSGLSAAVQTGLGPACLLGNLHWGEIPTSGRMRPLLSTGRGVVLALPLVIVFGSLLVSADADFEQLVTDLFRWDVEEVISHVSLIAVLSWVATGLMSHLVPEADQILTDHGRPPTLPVKGGWLGITETAIVLATLDVLFLAFVAVQSRYFFGGAAVVATSDSLSYAEYARRGFFELVTVAALVLPLLLTADWALRRERRRDVQVFRGLAGLLIILVFIIMASALQRMFLYQGQYGLTELRLYTTAFMGWLAVTFLWLMATVLSGRRGRFAFGTLVAALVFAAGLNVLNPDAFIVDTNLRRPSFDAYYNANLSADAVPTLVAALTTLPEAEAGPVAGCVLNRWSRPPYTDVRSWNAARHFAWQTTDTNDALLRKLRESVPAVRSRQGKVWHCGPSHQ